MINDQKTTISTKNSYAKEFFLYLLSGAMFFIGLIALIAIGFAFIEYFIPDPTAYYSALSTYGTIHMSIAMLVVIFPVYLIIQRTLIKESGLDPQIKDLRVRKWSLWFIFFLSATTLIIDGIVIIYNFLTGDLTLQFGLKLALVASTASFALTYVRAEIKDYFDNSSYTRFPIVVMSSIKIIAIIAIGFYITGGPAHQRNLRIDQQTITDLDIIVSHVNGFYVDKKALPQDKDELIKSINTFVIDEPIEKLRDGVYNYKATSSKSFELCADFLTETNDDKNIGRDAYQNNNFSHPKGNHCFKKEVIEPNISDITKPLPYIR